MVGSLELASLESVPMFIFGLLLIFSLRAFASQVSLGISLVATFENLERSMSRGKTPLKLIVGIVGAGGAAALACSACCLPIVGALVAGIGL